MVRPYKNVEELELAIKTADGFSTADTKKILLALPMMIKQNQEIIKLLNKQRRKRKQSDWNRYVSTGLRHNQSMRQIADNWKFIKGHYNEQS